MQTRSNKILVDLWTSFPCAPSIMLRLFHAHHCLEFLLFIIINLFLCSNDKSENISRLPCNLWGHFSIFFTCRASVGLPWAPSRRYHLHLLNPDQSSTAPWQHWNLCTARGSCVSSGTKKIQKRDWEVRYFHVWAGWRAFYQTCKSGHLMPVSIVVACCGCGLSVSLINVWSSCSVKMHWKLGNLRTCASSFQRCFTIHLQRTVDNSCHPWHKLGCWLLTIDSSASGAQLDATGFLVP